MPAGAIVPFHIHRRIFQLLTPIQRMFFQMHRVEWIRPFLVQCHYDTSVQLYVDDNGCFPLRFHAIFASDILIRGCNGATEHRSM